MKQSEWGSWARQFEAHDNTDSFSGKVVHIPAKCLFPEIEGPHKVACRDKASCRSPDDYPVCSYHAGIKIRPEWKGFIRGA